MIFSRSNEQLDILGLLSVPQMFKVEARKMVKNQQVDISVKPLSTFQRPLLSASQGTKRAREASQLYELETRIIFITLRWVVRKGGDVGADFCYLGIFSAP